MAGPRPPGPLIQLYCVPRDGAHTRASTGCSYMHQKHWSRNQFCPNGSPISGHSGSAAGRTHFSSAQRAGSQCSSPEARQRARRKVILLSELFHVLAEMFGSGRRSVCLALPECSSLGCSFVLLIQPRTEELQNPMCDSPQLLFLKQTT